MFEVGFLKYDYLVLCCVFRVMLVVGIGIYFVVFGVFFGLCYVLLFCIDEFCLCIECVVFDKFYV